MTGLFGTKDDDQRHDQPPRDAGPEPGASPLGGAPAPEPEIDVERTLKELAARMSKLSTSIEGMRDERTTLETKLTTFEDRLGRLGTLAETISSQYNPFLAERSPDEPAWGGDDVLDRALAEDGPVPSAHQGSSDGDPAARESDPGSVAPAPTPAPATAPRPRVQVANLDLGRTAGPDAEGPALQRNVILLRWVGHLVERVGRSGLLDLLDYYENLGWLDEATKHRALKVAVGIEAPDAGHDWRGDVALHQRSLVTLERLRGRDVPAARVEEMRLDLDRLFRE